MKIITWITNPCLFFCHGKVCNIFFLKKITWVGKYNEIYPEPEGKAWGISLGLKLYFIVYPSSRHNTDTVNTKYMFQCLL